jgi:homoserine acetyltransferase
MTKNNNNNQIALDKTTNIVYNTDMISNDNNNEREIKMTLTPNELLAMVASVQSDEIELDEVDMRCDEAEYEYHEANWEEIESDDGHQELYED